MSYCINPWCSQRNNAASAKYCQTCRSSLLIEGRYRILRSLLDANGHPYTEVFEVEDVQTGGVRQVLKTLKDQSNPKLEELFEQERKILSELRHPSIPRYENAFSIAIAHPTHRELPCIVMQLIEGENLENWVNRGQKLPDEATALNWFAQIAKVLDYVHQKDFFHRDIKPSNIIRQPNGQLVLIDFGIARRLTQTVVNGRSITQVYTAGYTAPEQHDGRAVPPSDFYALGRTFLHLLTGHHPSDVDIAYWDTMIDFIPSDRFRNLINQCVNYDPQRRPASAKAILNEIQTIQTGTVQTGVSTTSYPQTISPVPIPGQSEVKSKPKLFRLSRRPYILIALGLLGVLLAFVIHQCSQSPQLTNINPFQPDPTPLLPVEQLVSYGQRQIADNKIANLNTNEERLKQKGMDALDQADSTGDFSQAIKIFETLRQSAKQDPETLIYPNNARSRERSLREKTPLYTIAVAMPLNLIEIDAGRKTLFGVAQFQDQVVYKRPLELRSEKINLEVVIANDRGSRSQAKEIAEYLTTTKVHGQPIAAVIGHYTSPITCDTLKIYSQAKMVLMSSTSTIVNLRNCGDSNSVFFRTISTTQTEAETLFKAFQQQVPNGKKIGIFYNAKEGFSQDLFNQFSAILKRENIEFVTQNLAESFDVEQKVTEMQDAAALAIFPDGQTNNADAFNRGVKVLEQNQAKKLVLAANTFYNNPMRERVKRLTENRSNPAPMIVSADWFYEQDRAENFRRDINEYWGGDLGDKIALAYEAAQALVTALKNSPRDLRQSLSQINLESDVRKGRMIRFDRSGDRQSPERVALKTSKTGFVLLNPQ